MLDDAVGLGNLRFGPLPVVYEVVVGHDQLMVDANLVRDTSQSVIDTGVQFSHLSSMSYPLSLLIKLPLCRLVHPSPLNCPLNECAG